MKADRRVGPAAEEIKNMGMKEKLFEKLDRYCRMDTAASPDSVTYPSTPGQGNLARALFAEMKKAGFKKVSMDKYCYVTGELPSNVSKKVPVIGFLAHMDTSPAASGRNVKPVLHGRYSGGKIEISKKLGIILTPENCPPLKDHKGDDIVTASGDTLLGADNKAGIAIIMAAAEYLTAHPEIKHGKIKVAFTPDEEVGNGVSHFDVKKFGADFAYTFDGDVKGAVESETFNADGVSIKVKGKSVHPGTAKNAMANAVRIVSDIIASWPENMLPETTEGHDGFIMFDEIKGNIEQAEVSGIVREHDSAKLKKMEKLLEKIVEEKKLKYPLAGIKVEFREQYRNMKRVIDRHPEVMEKLVKAVKEAGLKPHIKPVRGGTDGARLSYMGLPTPNVFTGGYNYHGPYEWVSLDSMVKSYEVFLNLCRLWAE